MFCRPGAVQHASDRLAAQAVATRWGRSAGGTEQVGLWRRGGCQETGHREIQHGTIRVKRGGSLAVRWPGTRYTTRGPPERVDPNMPVLDLQRLQALRDHPASKALVRVAARRPCHVVGGAIRDALLGRDWQDVDLLVAGEGQRIARQLADQLGGRLVDLGRGEFASWRIVVDGHAYDLWDRGEDELEDELRRRDLTINALAYSLPQGTLIDPCGGLADLEAGRLAATTADSFELDPLRVLRLVRQQVELSGFHIEPSTRSLARRSAPAIGRVAAERVREECERILGGERPWEAHRPLVETDLYPRLWNGQSQEPAGTEHDDRLERLPMFPRLRERLPVDPVALTSGDWAGLAVDAVLVTVLDSPPAALEFLDRRAFRTRLWLSRLSRILSWPRLPRTAAVQRRFLHHCGGDWLAAVLTAGILAATSDATASWTVAVDSIGELAANAGHEVFDPPELLGGERVMAFLGIGPGPDVGQALDALHAARVLGTVQTAEGAEEFLRQLADRGVLPRV
jgi:hypothetical protein